MGLYPTLQLTAQGRALYAKVQAGASMIIKEVQIGDDVPSDPVNIDTMTSLVNSMFTLSIDELITDGAAGICYVKAHKDNSGIDPATYPNGVSIKEIGLIATDPDVGDILYAYTYQDDSSIYDTIPPNNYGSSTWSFKLSILLDDVSNVTAAVEGSIINATKIDIDGDNGYTQLRLRKSYTPIGASDTNGQEGDVAWDDNYVYLKTSTGWKRSALSIF